MRDVADVAGVSVKTVSRVINGEPGVSEELRTRVRDAVGQLDYQRDDRARSLKSGHQRTRTIGLVTVDVSNPFHAELNRSIEDEAARRGHLLITGSSDESPDRERALVQEFAQRRVDALIVAPCSLSEEHLQREMELGTPIVMIDRAPAHLECDYVATDNVAGSRAAVGHMIENGHRRIAFVGDSPSIWTAWRRLVGYERELEAAGTQIQPELVVTGVRGAKSAAEAVRSLFSNGAEPTAIFAQNLITMGVVKALHELGLAESVAVVGFDDLEFADLVTPGVSVVAQNPRRMGRLAAERLFARIEGDESEAMGMLLEPALIRRGSGEIRA